MRKRLIVTLLVGLWLVLAAGPLAAQTPGVYDRGWSPHAQGTVNGNMYTVVWGDTVFSIARRFGVAESTLMNTNGIPSPYRLQAGQPIIIPGLGPGPGPNPCPSPFLAITNRRPAPWSASPSMSAAAVAGCPRALSLFAR